ncbi:MAG TPA: hypothetical protein EYP98_21975, partial [Planctomycetes bacterium]|nr:hypothetical protein [Planctomycetota bacterium]
MCSRIKISNKSRGSTVGLLSRRRCPGTRLTAFLTKASWAEWHGRWHQGFARLPVFRRHSQALAGVIDNLPQPIVHLGHLAVALGRALQRGLGLLRISPRQQRAKGSKVSSRHQVLEVWRKTHSLLVPPTTSRHRSRNCCHGSMRTAAYVYTGWHAIAERDEAFHPGFTEWELVRNCQPRFEGHAQPKVPLLGEYDDRDPIEFGKRITLAHEHGVDAFVFGVFWCRGKRVFEVGLDQGFLGSAYSERLPFACMWANRMPRRVLPVRRTDAPVIDPSRAVPSDQDDFVQFVAMLANNYFHRQNYVTVEGRSYLSIYDSTFFVQELGIA